MTNINKIGTSYESMGKHPGMEKAPYIDERLFCTVHKPAQTEKWQILKESFVARRNLENEKLNLKKERHVLIDQYHNLMNDLSKAMSMPATTPEEVKAKQSKIEGIMTEMKKTAEKIKEKNKEIQKKEVEINNKNKEIQKQAEEVKKEELNILKSEENDSIKKDEAIAALKEKLAA